MEIRTAEKKDAAEMEAIAVQEGEDYWSEDDFLQMLDNEDAIVIVAEGADEADGIMGYVTGFIVPTKRNEAMLHESRVDTNFRGQKIGSSLVESFCNEAFSRGAETVYALLEEKHKPFYIDACNFKETHTWIEASKKKD